MDRENFSVIRYNYINVVINRSAFFIIHMVDSPQNEKRSYYRLKYPKTEQPTIRINDREFPVIEISEKGIKVSLTREFSTESDEFISAVIEFQDGESISIEGVVLRRDEESMVVKLSKGISMKRMLVEQSRLRHSHPMLFTSSGGRDDVNNGE